MKYNPDNASRVYCDSQVSIDLTPEGYPFISEALGCQAQLSPLKEDEWKFEVTRSKSTSSSILRSSVIEMLKNHSNPPWVIFRGIDGL